MQKKSKGENKKSTLLFAAASGLLFITGAIIFLYPIASNWLAVINQTGVIQEYREKINDEDKEFYDIEWRKAQEYNDNLAGDPVRDPFVPGTGYALPDNYMDCLNIGGVMGYIEIPEINLSLPIYHGTGEDVLEKGVGHIESTALPIGGEFTHAVLTGHRGLPGAELFTDLDRLEKGDHFYIYILDEVLAYEVDDINTVLPEELYELKAINGRDLVTLVTCTPYGVNTHRLLVRGTRIPYVPEELEKDRSAAGIVSVFGIDLRLQYMGVAVGILFLIIAAVVVFIRKKHHEKEDKS